MKIRMAAALAFAAACSVSGTISAQPAWPAKPIRLVVPFPAGGATDILSRSFAQGLSENIGQPVIVDNRPGAAGAIGSDIVAKASPDGYVLLVGTSSTHSIAPHVVQQLPYDAAKDFSPVTQLASGTSLLVVSPMLPAKDVAELIGLAKAAPGKMSYGSSGNGSIPHLMAAYFESSAGIDAIHVPYKGSSQSYADLSEGRIDFLFDSIVSSLPQVRAGSVRALASTGRTRSPLVPDIPTVAESGLSSYDSTTWFGLLGPAGMDKRVVALLNAAASKALASEAIRSRFAQLGVDPVGGSSEEFRQTIASESLKWQNIIRDGKIDSK